MLCSKSFVNTSLAPSAPGGFTLFPVAGSPEQLEANWTIPDPANGVIQNYSVICNSSVLFSFDGSDDVVVIVHLTGLLPFTVYECTVSAATNGGMGNASESAMAMTNEAGKES